MGALNIFEINSKPQIKYIKMYGIWRNWQILIVTFCENKNGYVLGEEFIRPRE